MKPAAAGASASSPAPADWSRTQERSNALALRLMSWIAVTCGRRVARGVLHLITLYFLLFAAGPRRHSARYLARALGRPARWRERYRHIHSFAATVLDRVYFLRGQMAPFEITVQGHAVIEATLAEGRGAFLLGAHMGSFEALHAAGKKRPGLNIAMVMYPDNAQLINAALQAIAPGFKMNIIALGRREATLAIRDWLDEGGLAGMLGDRSLPSESARAGVVRLPFLGQEVDFSDGPFRLALLLRRRVVFMVGLYGGGGRYDVRFEPLADFTELIAPAERERHIRAAIEAYVARLEALCRESPYNWFNFYDFWREDGVL